jgi:hypothetical protein
MRRINSNGRQINVGTPGEEAVALVKDVQEVEPAGSLAHTEDGSCFLVSRRIPERKLINNLVVFEATERVCECSCGVNFWKVAEESNATVTS